MNADVAARMLPGRSQGGSGCSEGRTESVQAEASTSISGALRLGEVGVLDIASEADESEEIYTCVGQEHHALARHVLYDYLPMRPVWFDLFKKKTFT